VVSRFVLKEYNGACQSHAAMRRGGVIDLQPSRQRSPAAMPSLGTARRLAVGIPGVVHGDAYGAWALKQGGKLIAEQQLEELGVNNQELQRRQPLCCSK
jgi:hypothetical protein